MSLHPKITPAPDSSHFLDVLEEKTQTQWAGSL